MNSWVVARLGGELNIRRERSGFCCDYRKSKWWLLKDGLVVCPDLIEAIPAQRDLETISKR